MDALSTLDAVVNVLNLTDTLVFVDMYNGRKWRISPMSKMPVPAEAAKLWFGDPGAPSSQWSREVSRLSLRNEMTWPFIQKGQLRVKEWAYALSYDAETPVGDPNLQTQQHGIPLEENEIRELTAQPVAVRESVVRPTEASMAHLTTPSAVVGAIPVKR